MFLLAVALIGSLGVALGQDCASLPASSEFWSLVEGGQVQNNAEGGLVLSYDATDSLLSSYGAHFAEPQDLTQHALLSFNLYKVRQPVALYVAITTPHGEHRSDVAALFEGHNTITLDLASSEFAVGDADAFDQPIVGLSQVSAVRLYLVASELGHGEATLDSMMICASTDTANDLPLEADPVATTEGAVAYPDVASLSAALDAAVGEVQRLSSDIDELMLAQRKVERSFQEFGVRSRDTLEKAVNALSSAMESNVEQTLTNAKLLKRLRETVGAATAEHDARLTQLDRQYSALRTLAVRPGESLDEAVARTNAREVEVVVETTKIQLQKRAVQKAKLAAEADAAAAAAVDHKVQNVQDAFHIASNNKPSRRMAKRTVIPSPLQ